MVKRVAIAIMSVRLMLLVNAGCSKVQNDSTVSISSPIEAYTPYMSSVPGLPLNVMVNGEDQKGNNAYAWKTDEGGFLTWNSKDGTIKELGSKCTIKESTIYWIPDLNKKVDEGTFKITLEVKSS